MSTYKEHIPLSIEHNSKRRRGRETKQKVFLLVEENEPNGLTLGELVEATKKSFLQRDCIEIGSVISAKST